MFPFWGFLKKDNKNHLKMANISPQKAVFMFSVSMILTPVLVVKKVLWIFVSMRPSKYPGRVRLNDQSQNTGGLLFLSQ